MALDRLGRHPEALALCDEIMKEGPPTEDTLISTMAVVLVGALVVGAHCFPRYTVLTLFMNLY